MKTNKGKRLRRRVSKGPVKSKVEQLYDQVVHLGVTLPVNAKQEKFIPLLALLLQGRIDTKTAKHIVALPDDKYVYGTVETVFKTNTALRYYTDAKFVLLPDQIAKNSGFVGTHNKGAKQIHLIHHTGKVFKYNPGSLVYMELQEQKELPADLRKWDPRISKTYISLNLAKMSGENRRTRDKQTTSSVIKEGVKSIHQIRRINVHPSKKQLEARTRPSHVPQRYKSSYSMAAVSQSMGYVNPAGETALKKSKEKLFDY